MKRANAVGKTALIDLLDSELPETFNLLKKKKKQTNTKITPAVPVKCSKAKLNKVKCN